jgi:MoxR-like ATPase
VDYPDAERELEILRVKTPEAAETLSRQVVAFVQRLRRLDLFKLPGIAETIDWNQALTRLDVVSLNPDVVNDTLGALLKYQDDIVRVRESEAARILDEISMELRAAPR